jgi:hypothetical protein
MFIRTLTRTMTTSVTQQAMKAEAAAAGFAAARITNIRDVGDIRCLELHVEPDTTIKTGKLFTFKPGQWVDYLIHETGAIGGYSLTSSPESLPTLTLAIKNSDWPPAKYVHDNEKTKVGQQIWIRSGGSIYWDAKTTPQRTLMLSAGIGATPFLSMLQHLALSPTATDSRAAIVHSQRSGGGSGGGGGFRGSGGSDWPISEMRTEFTFADTTPTSIDRNHHMDRMDRIRCFPVATDGSGKGRLSREHIEAALTFLEISTDCTSGAVVPYVCGPPTFVDYACKLLESFETADVQIERWW